MSCIDTTSNYRVHKSHNGNMPLSSRLKVPLMPVYFWLISVSGYHSWYHACWWNMHVWGQCRLIAKSRLQTTVVPHTKVKVICLQGHCQLYDLLLSLRRSFSFICTMITQTRLLYTSWIEAHILKAHSTCYLSSHNALVLQPLNILIFLKRQCLLVLCKPEKLEVFSFQFETLSSILFWTTFVTKT